MFLAFLCEVPIRVNAPRAQLLTLGGRDAAFPLSR